jgi:hypothetical protein
VIWLIVYAVGLPVQILHVCSSDMFSQTLFIALMLYIISSFTSSIVAVVWVSVIKRERFIEIIERISEVDNKIRYTLQEETYMNKNVILNIFSEIILLAVIQCNVIIYYVYQFRSEEYYVIILILIGTVATYICNTLFLFQYLNLVFIVKQRYSHLNKRLANWINVTVSRQIGLDKENERCIRTHWTVYHVNITPLCVSSVGNIEGTLKQTDIHTLRQIYSELYDITCLINDTYGVPILASICWIFTTVLCCLYEILINLEGWGVADIVYGITCSVLIFKIIFYCHSATNEARSSRILLQKLILEGNCRNECVKELKMFSVQLQVMKFEYTACGYFSLNLRLFTTFVSVTVSYFIVMVQIK